tara:strand:+ start:947 stop:1291 length:345 start_codon:yes stop_codon:yes gene_type:complete
LSFLKSKAFIWRKFFFIFFLFVNLLISNQIFATKKRRIISGVEVKVYKKERKHIEISALLCALALNEISFEDIRKTLEINFQKPISRSDQFLIVDIMESMCPEFDNKKLFENHK